MDSGVITIMEKSKFNPPSQWLLVCLSSEYKVNSTDKDICLKGLDQL